MDHDGQKELTAEEMEEAQIMSYINLVKDRLRHEPKVFSAFVEAICKYKQERISFSKLYAQVAKVFVEHSDLFHTFYNYFPRPNFYDDRDALRLSPTKRAETEDDSAEAMEFDSTSNASTSLSSNYSEFPHSNSCFPINYEASTSGTISSHSLPENADGASSSGSSQSSPGNKLHGAQKEATPQYIDGTLYVNEVKQRTLNCPAAYENYMELVNQIKADGADIPNLMERAAKELQGYPDLIENFNDSLPYGYKIVTVTNDYQMIDD